MQLWVSERAWCDFVSFDPRLSGKAGYLEQRVYRDDEFIYDMKTKTYEFVGKMKELINKLK